MTGQGYRFGGKKAQLLKVRLRQVQVATDRGYGHRGNSHDRTNLFDAHEQQTEHAAWESGWRQADRDLNGCER